MECLAEASLSGSLQCKGLSVAPNARERVDGINGQSEAAAEGTRAASEHKSHPRQSRQARGHHAAPLGELSLQLSHGPAASEAHTIGLLIDHQLPQLWTQIHGPVGLCRTTTGGPSTADFQWFVLGAAVEQRCDLRGRGGENSGRCGGSGLGIANGGHRPRAGTLQSWRQRWR